jgi:hypothetical protein
MQENACNSLCALREDWRNKHHKRSQSVAAETEINMIGILAWVDEKPAQNGLSALSQDSPIHTTSGKTSKQKKLKLAVRSVA